jgi:hypothetical protein
MSDTNTSFNLQEAQAKVAASNDVAELKEVFANVALFAAEIAKRSEEIVAEREAKNNELAKVEQAKNDAIAASAALEGQLTEVKNTLAELQAVQAAAEQERKFNERMAALDDTFELSDEERGLLIDEVKTLEDESFAKWLNKNKVLMREKTKDHLKAKAAKKADKAKDCDCEDEEDETEEEGKCGKAKASEVIASVLTEVTASQVEKTEHNEIEAVTDLKAKMKETFASGITVGGKKVKDFTK